MTTQDLAASCVFCRIARGDFSTEFVFETEHVVAFRDIQPQAPTHVLVIPRRHIGSLNELTDADQALAGELLAVAAKIAEQEGIADDGYRVLTNTGPNAGQSVFHLHLHVIGGRRLGIGLA